MTTKMNEEHTLELCPACGAIKWTDEWCSCRPVEICRTDWNYVVPDQTRLFPGKKGVNPAEQGAISQSHIGEMKGGDV